MAAKRCSNELFQLLIQLVPRSCLEDVPLEVLKVVMFMIRTWKSTDAAFSQLNTQPDNMLNHKEFVDGLARAGCCRSRRKKTMEKVRPAMSPKEDEEDPLQLEAISSSGA